MNLNDRLDKFLKLQNKGKKFSEIAKEMEISESTLRRFLNKEGYRSKDGIYKSEIDTIQKQVSFEEINNKKNVKNKEVKRAVSKKNVKKETKKNIKNDTKKVSIKKDRKINITQEDIDKLCEVYDWYLQIKDNKNIKTKNKNKKDIQIDELSVDLKSKHIKVDEKIWDDFERLCSNSQHKKSDLINQALKEFMSQYKHLL